MSLLEFLKNNPFFQIEAARRAAQKPKSKPEVGYPSPTTPSDLATGRVVRPGEQRRTRPTPGADQEKEL